MVCISGSGVISDGKSTLDLFDGVEGGGYEEIDGNATSLGFVLRFKDFRYFTAGDLSGGVGKVFAETGMAKSAIRPDGAVTFMKANHHGSLENNPDELLKAIDPDMIIIPCAIKRWALPRDEFIRGAINYFRKKDRDSKISANLKRLIFANCLSTAETRHINPTKNASDFELTNLIKTELGDYETLSFSSIVITAAENTVTTLKDASDTGENILDFTTSTLVGCVYEHYSTLSSPVKTKISHVATCGLPKFPNIEFKLFFKNALPKSGQAKFEKIYGDQKSGKVSANPANFLSCVSRPKRKKYRDDLISTYKDVAVGLALIGSGLINDDLKGQNEDAALVAFGKASKAIAKDDRKEYSSLIEFSKRAFGPINKKLRNMLKRERQKDELHREIMKKLQNDNLFLIGQEGMH